MKTNSAIILYAFTYGPSARYADEYIAFESEYLPIGQSTTRIQILSTTTLVTCRRASTGITDNGQVNIMVLFRLRALYI